MSTSSLNNITVVVPVHYATPTLLATHRPTRQNATVDLQLTLRPWLLSHLAAVEDVGLSHGLEGGGPEPSPDVVWLEAVLLAAVHLLVTEAARGPHLPHVAALHRAANIVLLVGVLESDL